MSRLTQADIVSAYDDEAREQWSQPRRKTIRTSVPDARSSSGFPIIRHTDAGRIVRVWTDTLDTNAWRQSVVFADMPFTHKKGLALMGDVHFGRDVPVGCVLPTLGALVPAAVGTDIGCGMMAVRLNITASQLPDHLKPMRLAIEKAIPLGSGGRRKVITPSMLHHWEPLSARYDQICQKYPMAARARAIEQLGTLGSGNHFIEVCVDGSQQVWVMLHSGSRGVGGGIGQHFIDVARRRSQANGTNIGQLGWFPDDDPLFHDYADAVLWGQEFASANRQVMMEDTLAAIQGILGHPLEVTGSAINCHHNYIAHETHGHEGEKVWITRKGAIRAGLGEWGIIPGCFAAGTRILMSNGLYKDIECVDAGDKVISGAGVPTRVVRRFDKGERSVIKYKNNCFYKESIVTSDHLHYAGDMSSANIQKEGRVKILDRPNRDGSSKYGWMKIGEMIPSHTTLLMPRQISFDDMSNSLNLSFQDKKINQSYDLGYVVGTFVGDGTSHYASRSGGQVSWSYGLHEAHIADKTARAIEAVFGVKAKKYETKNMFLVVVHSADFAKMFCDFGKKTTKSLPIHFWCSDLEYLKGVFDGLIDSDGHINGKTKKLTNTSPVCIEQFGVIHYLLFGYFPSVSIRAPSNGGFENCTVENCSPSYRSTGLMLPPLSKSHQLVELLEIDKNPFSVDVFDLEVEDSDHSFIANNAIVHNSMGAESFIVKGKGDPQSFCSCSHGAGRVMSRTAAKEQFTVKDLKRQTAGVECRTIKALVDEIPSAYKPIRKVMSQQEDLVEVVHSLKAIICVKGC